MKKTSYLILMFIYIFLIYLCIRGLFIIYAESTGIVYILLVLFCIFVLSSALYSCIQKIFSNDIKNSYSENNKTSLSSDLILIISAFIILIISMCFIFYNKSKNYKIELEKKDEMIEHLKSKIVEYKNDEIMEQIFNQIRDGNTDKTLEEIYEQYY